MSDEQWLWLFVNQRIDTDEKLEKMCPECREEVTSSHKCIRCGKDIIEEFVNPNFDMDRYNMLAGHVEEMYKEDNDFDDYEDEDHNNEHIDDDEYYYDDNEE